MSATKCLNFLVSTNVTVEVWCSELKLGRQYSVLCGRLESQTLNAWLDKKYIPYTLSFLSRSGEETNIVCPSLHAYRMCKLHKDLAPATQKNTSLWNILVNDLECHMLVSVLCRVLQDAMQCNPFLLPTCLLKCFVVRKTCHHQRNSQFKSSSTRGQVWILVIVVTHYQRRKGIKSVMYEEWTYFVYSKLYHQWTG